MNGAQRDFVKWTLEVVAVLAGAVAFVVVFFVAVRLLVSTLGEDVANIILIVLLVLLFAAYGVLRWVMYYRKLGEEE